MAHAQDEGLRWYAGVPVGTNPLILLDFATILTVAFLLTWLILLASQFYFDGSVQAVHLRGAAVIAFDFCLLFTLFYVVVSFLIMRNRYAAYYRFDKNGAHCNNLKCYPKELTKCIAHFRCFPIETPNDCIRNVEKHASWADVEHVVELESLRVLLLKGRHGTLMRVYCPDAHSYAEALDYSLTKCRERLSH